jgi:2-oxoglutarate dehydrogenase E2 component (dihydrolipoamide succinyltransferase)
MAVNIMVPEVGESIVDARVAKWLKHEGDAVEAGEAVVELETDKIDLEVSAPRKGVLKSIAHGDGADVKIGDVLGVIDEQGNGAAASGPAAKPKTAQAKAQGAGPSGPAGKKEAGPSGPARTEQEADKQEAGPDKPEAGALAPAKKEAGPGPAAPATPSARKLAREQDVALTDVKSSGPRVTKADVEKYDTTRGAEAPAPAAPPALREARVDGKARDAKPPAPRPTGDRAETRQRMSKRRATIARRLVEAQQTAAMLTTFNEVDMTHVMQLRERQKEAFKAQHGVGLGVASFFVKATVAALKEFPRLNAEIQGDEMVLKHYYDIGVAVSADEGLVVPVLRDADRMSFAEIEQGIRGFATKAKDGTLTLDDLRGGTFSVTNGGVFGSLMSTPIINPPQVGILGLHAIKDRAVVVTGQVVVRPMIYTALTYDHRIVDGSEAVRFLVRIKELVEDPATMLIAS